MRFQSAEMDILVMRAFLQLRALLTSREQFTRKLAALERKLVGHDEQLATVFDAIRQLMAPIPSTRARPIGFAQNPGEC